MAVDEVKETASGVGGTEHDKAMIEKAETSDIVKETIEANKEPETTGDRPDWLPSKYKTVEDFVKGHEELEKKLGSEDELPSEGEEQEFYDDDDADEPADEFEDPLAPFHEEWAQDGKLSEDSYKKLNELGFSDDIIDTYIDGYQAQIEAIQAEAHDIVGGEDEYNNMVEWAVANLTESELNAYNSQLATNDKSQWEIALLGLHAKYAKSGDAPVERIKSGQKNTPSQLQPFSSQTELKAAMADKRYRTSPEYREAVMKRLEISEDEAMGAGNSGVRVSQVG